MQVISIYVVVILTEIMALEISLCKVNVVLLITFGICFAKSRTYDTTLPVDPVGPFVISMQPFSVA